MTGPGTGFPQWAVVDEGWGRKAVDFATGVPRVQALYDEDLADGGPSPGTQPHA